MAQLVRVGVIGTGFGADVVAPAFAVAADCEVVDVVTPRDDAAVAALCGRADLDLISIHSPPFLHVEHVRRATQRGHAVLCDKPFGRNAEESAKMVDLAKEAGVVGLVNFERRFDASRERLRTLIFEGTIGEANHFQYSRFIAVPEARAFGWLSNKELGGGWLGGQGSHLIDACRWLFGEIAEAGAVMRTLITERATPDGELLKCDAEDGFVASLRTGTGVTAVIDCALESSVSTPERMAVFGSTGMLEIGDVGIVGRMADGSLNTYKVDTPTLTPLIGRWEGPDRRARHGPAALAMERWAPIVLDAVRGGVIEPDSPTFVDGLVCALVMDRMRQ